MYDSESPSSPASAPVAGDLGPVRADSEVRLVLRAHDGGTHVAQLFERGSFRARFPRGPDCEAVLLNTGGGMTGGDRLGVDLTLERGAHAVVTSQAAEKIYRSDGPPAVVAIKADVHDDSRLEWLPQETILFDRARVRRTLDLELAASASLTMLESLVLGRLAHGEQLQDACWRDSWRVRRGGRLIFAETVHLDGRIADVMNEPAIGAGARAAATLLHVAPDAEAKLDLVRSAMEGVTSICAASAWNGMLVARFAAADPQSVRRDCSAAMMALRAAPMPRAWSC